MFRREFIAAALGLAAWLLPSSLRAQTGPKSQPGQGSRTEPTLQETLEKGLKVRRPQDFAFIKRVVELVKKGTLSERMVRTTFLWARQKTNREFQYFERGITLRAARKGIRI